MQQIYIWLDQLWQWISERIFIRFEFDIQTEKLKQYANQNRLCFVLTRGGFLDWLILSSWCRQNGLGAILIANRKRILFLAKPLYFLQRVFRQKSDCDLFLLEKECPRLLFLSQKEGEKTLSQIYFHSSKTAQAQWNLVPVLIIWKNFSRGAPKKLTEFILGTAENPNIFLKIWYLARKRKDSLVKELPHIQLASVDLAEESALHSDPDGIKAARSIRRKILISIQQEMRIIMGPRYSSPEAVRESIFRDPDIQKLITEKALEEALTPQKVSQITYEYLHEMVSYQHSRTVAICAVLFKWLFEHIFSGFNHIEEEIQQVREVMKSKGVALISNHRSHFDYLVFPYLLYQYKMSPPYIVAGNNMAFWPLGGFMKSGGAIFIRRSFRGNKLYNLCLKKYLEHLIKQKVNILFFIEGTRSRSGKMLAPQYGILKKFFEIVEDGSVSDVAIIPVSLSYDQIPEEQSYSKELQGATKAQESAKNLLKARKTFFKNLGTVYLRFGKPLSLKEANDEEKKAGASSTLILQKEAFVVSKTISDISPITPKAILSTVLLYHPDLAIPLDQIIKSCLFLARYVFFSKNPCSFKNEEELQRSIEIHIKSMVASGTLKINEISVPKLYYVDEKKRGVLNYYKNNAIHCFQMPALFLLSFLESLSNPASKNFFESIKIKALILRNILKFEFFYNPSKIFVEEIQKTGTFFFEENWNETVVNTWLQSLEKNNIDSDNLIFFIRIIGDLLESYQTVFSYFKNNPTQTVEKKSLIQKMIKFASIYELKGKIIFSESVSAQNYSNALMLLENMKLLGLEKQSDKTLISITPWNPTWEKFYYDLKLQLQWQEINYDKLIEVIDKNRPLV